MQFTLTYRGPLKSNAKAKDKHILRRHFHSQLKHLWTAYPMKEYREWLEEPGEDKNKISVLRPKHGFVFAPLVCRMSHAVVELDIKLLWPHDPGTIISSGGDIDNRLKTLFDSLKYPSEPNSVPPGLQPEDGESPFFCLLEDDSLIVRVNVDSDRLLEDAGQSDVSLFIKVTTRNLGNTWDALP